MSGEGQNPPPGDAPRTDGSGRADNDAQGIWDLIREERRLTMQARTIAISLESALDDFEMAAAGTDVELSDLRRQWCERVLEMVQEVRARAMRNRHAYDLVAAQVKVGRSGTARFAAARREFERQAGLAEELARAALDDGA